ncbi:MAG: hypothetical protein ACPGVU_12805 [Limisphaerales bacterium]
MTLVYGIVLFLSWRSLVIWQRIFCALILAVTLFSLVRMLWLMPSVS